MIQWLSAKNGLLSQLGRIMTKRQKDKKTTISSQVTEDTSEVQSSEDILKLPGFWMFFYKVDGI